MSYGEEPYLRRSTSAGKLAGRRARPTKSRSSSSLVSRTTPAVAARTTTDNGRRTAELTALRSQIRRLTKQLCGEAQARANGPASSQGSLRGSMSDDGEATAASPFWLLPGSDATTMLTAAGSRPASTSIYR